MARPALSEDYHRVVGTRATRANVEPSPHISGRPTRPNYFTPVGKKEWNRIVKILTERGTCTRGDGPIIELYVSTYCDWRACNEEVEAQGRFVTSTWKDETGEHTSRVPNPALKIAAQLANQLRALQIQLGVTPTAREKAKQTRLNPKMKEFPIGSAGWLRAQQKKAAESTADEQEEVLL
jgi:P27 family predicted phage terminase small subunit